MNIEQTREAIAEGIGTFMLVAVGAGAVAISGGNVVVAALSHGLILIAIISTYGHVSGAHVNPAVTLGLLAGGKIELSRAVIYWVAQLIGGLLAGVFLRLVLTGLEGAEALGQTVPLNDEINALDIILIEGALTFFLVSAVFQAAVYGRGGAVTPLIIGLTLAGCITFGGPLTGASLNPARTLGPALFAEDAQGLIEVGNYFIGILLGGTLAGFVHSDTFAPGDDEASPKGRRPKKR
ncbi:MAG: aquaporin [Chloroflexi bacterium]|nr:aquaporin [Chloroflexota bacterium]